MAQRVINYGKNFIERMQEVDHGDEIIFIAKCYSRTKFTALETNPLSNIFRLQQEPLTKEINVPGAIIYPLKCPVFTVTPNRLEHHEIKNSTTAA